VFGLGFRGTSIYACILFATACACCFGSGDECFGFYTRVLNCSFPVLVLVEQDN